MNLLATFNVHGIPAPKGSVTKMPNGAYLQGKTQNQRNKYDAWSTAVTTAARQMAETTPHDGPLSISIDFRLPMPKTRPAAAHEAGRWPHTVSPDIDKITRCTFDGLERAGLILNDARIYDMHVTAWEVTDWTGCEIRLYGGTPEEPTITNHIKETP